MFLRRAPVAHKWTTLNEKQRPTKQFLLRWLSAAAVFAHSWILSGSVAGLLGRAADFSEVKWAFSRAVAFFQGPSRWDLGSAASGLLVARGCHVFAIVFSGPVAGLLGRAALLAKSWVFQVKLLICLLCVAHDVLLRSWVFAKSLSLAFLACSVSWRSMFPKVDHRVWLPVFRALVCSGPVTGLRGRPAGFAKQNSCLYGC